MRRLVTMSATHVNLEPPSAEMSPLDAAPDEPLEIVFAEDVDAVRPAEGTPSGGKSAMSASTELGRGLSPGEDDARPV